MSKFLSIRTEGSNVGQLANIVSNAELGMDEVRVSLNVEDCNLTIFCRDVWEMHRVELIKVMSDVLEYYPFHMFEIEVDGNSPLINAFFEFLRVYTSYQLIVSPEMTDTSEGKRWYINKEFSIDILYESMPVPVIKFDVSRPSDFIEIGRFCQEYEIPRYMVWINPPVLEDSTWVLSHCLQNQYNYYPKL